MAIEEILDLEQLEVNIYRGGVFSPESGFLQRTFGGHVAGQSLVSAVRTVDPKFQVHSLHGYFLRPGDAKAPTVFIVERIRDGGSFCTRRVNAIQHGETIFSMSASFQTDQSGIEHQDAMPSAPPPDDLPDFSSRAGCSTTPDSSSSRSGTSASCRATSCKLLPGKASQQQVWFRHRDPLPDDPVLHICALAYMSDLTLLGSAQVTHLEERKHLMVASLDHAMWFMRPFRADEWLLYDQSSPSACGGRSLTQGKIFNRYGEMVAAVMQEGLTRYKRDFTTGRSERPRVGVLALQGDTREHLAALREAGADAITVRRRGELDAVDALVIPGGESTTMSHLLREFELLEPLRARLADGMPAYGSCAGMILLASEILDAGVAGPRGRSAARRSI